jgi:Zn-dependent peptidase ImmA (M78 family)/DNA-binding XRE family transcriptional regulator
MSDEALARNYELGQRLRDVRKKRKLTQEQVAETLAIARTTLVAIEKGERQVKPAELRQLAKLYGRHVDELVGERPSAESVAVQFRTSLGSKANAAEIQEAIADFEELCVDYVSLEQMLGYVPPQSFPPQYETSSMPVAGEDIASSERNRLGLGDGPIFNLRRILENEVGLRIFAFPLPSAIAGMFVFAADFGGCIAFNSRHPRDRQRWSLAHEYGHFLMTRYQPEVTILQAYTRSPKAERLVDYFAGSFLMPGAGLTRRFNALKREHGNDGITPADLLQLSSYYRVSLQALILRLEGLRLVPAGSWDRLDSKGFKVMEARERLDLSADAPDEELLPLRFKYLAVQAFNRGLLTEGKFARILRTNRVQARELVHSLSHATEVTADGELRPIPLDLSATSSP